ncbi:unnamed protein product [Anisakis simplex]|uniref:Transposase n=1 Tax=Anisakis simplex TaxID=6269 RepID=A0A0M3JDK1_ANISI|nr:unnamed protein product [Anisakis simplex]
MMDDQPEQVYEKIKKIFDNDETARQNVELLWRMAKACFLSGNKLQKKSVKRKLFIYEGKLQNRCAS